jgi:hypothetical protein
MRVASLDASYYWQAGYEVISLPHYWHQAASYAAR